MKKVHWNTLYITVTWEQNITLVLIGSDAELMQI